MSETVKESTPYDNYMDTATRSTDKYSVSLDRVFVDDPNDDVLVDRTKAKKTVKCFKEIYVHFRNLDDLSDFCTRIKMNLPGSKKEFWFAPVPGTFEVDRRMIASKRAKTTAAPLPFAKDIEGGGVNRWREHWSGMPAYRQEDKKTYRSITMRFQTAAEYAEFAELIDQELTTKAKAIWHPALETTANYKLRWIEDDPITLPRYPVYIVSKGRSESMHTSRSLARMRIPHYIVVEPQDMADYRNALIHFGIAPFVTLLEAPFSNHGDGPGRARNWAWDHSMALGAAAHWVMDDNISDFYRLHENVRIRYESGAGFRAMEDFFDRYENLYIAGPQYRFFIAPDQKYPPFVANTRIYSCLLIRNDCKHRWRGRYNEDTDLCLRVLKDGDCTVQFNAFMQGKSATQTVKGGNTQEFYHVEGDTNKEKWRDGQLNSEGTINKSKMLVDMHPDVARLVFRYGRWHHWVNYEPFKSNQLKLRPGVVIPKGVNEYGMHLIKNYGDE